MQYHVHSWLYVGSDVFLVIVGVDTFDRLEDGIHSQISYVCTIAFNFSHSTSLLHIQDIASGRSRYGYMPISYCIQAIQVFNRRKQ